MLGEVISLHTEGREVKVLGSNIATSIKYERLCLATGAQRKLIAKGRHGNKERI